MTTVKRHCVEPMGKNACKLCLILLWGVVLVLPGLGLASGCGASDRALRPVLPTALAGGLTFQEGALGYGDLRLGMARSSVQNILGIALSPGDTNDTGCDGTTTAVEVNGRRLLLDFSEGGSGSALQGIFAPLVQQTEAVARDALVRAIKQRVPTLQYQPSRHQPDQAEQDNPGPLYVLRTNPGVGILVKPQSGLYVYRVGCLD